MAQGKKIKIMSEKATNYGNFKTAYQMKEIVLRCLKEAKEVGYIVERHITTTDGKVVELDALVNSDELANHISKTIIGELLEFEIIRRQSAILRSQKSINQDIEYLDGEFANYQRNLALRIGQK